MLKNIETMTYKMQPAGHEAPQEKRKYENVKPDIRLDNLFQEWLKSPESHGVGDAQGYAIMMKELLNLQADGWQPSTLEAHVLLLKYIDHKNLHRLTHLMSGIYNLQPEKHIVFDIEMHEKFGQFGFKLKEDKVLVTKGPTGDQLGYFCDGTVLNYGETGVFSGHSLKGLLVDYGTAEEGYSYACGFPYMGIIIDLGKSCPPGENFRRLAGGYKIDYTNCESIEVAASEDVNLQVKENYPASEDLVRTIVQRNNLIVQHLKNGTEKPIPELRDYLQKLRIMLQPGKDDCKKALEVLDACKQNFNKTLGQKIQQDLDELFKRHQL